MEDQRQVSNSFAILRIGLAKELKQTNLEDGAGKSFEDVNE